MPASRNFRKVLGVDPDSSNPHCVGVRKDGGQCGLPMSNMSDRPRASALLTKMDTQALTDSYRDLEELAFLTLCSRWHRKPSHSQVGQVATRWRQKIQQFEREEEEIAMMARSRPALARKEATAEIMKVTVKNGRNEMISTTRQYPQKNRSSGTVKAANLVDPFVNSNSSSVHESVLETPFTQRLKASRTRTSETSHNTSSQQSTSNKAKLDIRKDSPTIPARISTLPSPPDTPLLLRQGDRQDTENEDKRERLPILANEFETETTEPADATKPFKFHQFGIRNSIEEQQQLSLSLADSTFRQPVIFPNYWPETPKSTPTSTLQKREIFGLGQHCITQATFNFETPSTSPFTKSVSDAPTTMCDNANHSDSEFKKDGTEQIDNEVQEMQAAQSIKQPEVNKDMQDTAPASMAPVEGLILSTMAKAVPGDDIAQTPDQSPDEENFGYAVITSSTRSRSYRPTTQRYGLVTPPEEPDNMDAPTIKSGYPAMGNGYPATPSLSTSQRKPFMIPRKPVNPAFKPVPPAKSLSHVAATQRGGGRAEAAKVTNGTTKSVKVEIRPCSPYPRDEGVQAGCLHIFGIRRFREKVVDKVEHVRKLRQFKNMKVTTA